MHRTLLCYSILWMPFRPLSYRHENWPYLKGWRRITTVLDNECPESTNRKIVTHPIEKRELTSVRPILFRVKIPERETRRKRYGTCTLVVYKVNRNRSGDGQNICRRIKLVLNILDNLRIWVQESQSFRRVLVGWLRIPERVQAIVWLEWGKFQGKSNLQ